MNLENTLLLRTSAFAIAGGLAIAAATPAIAQDADDEAATAETTSGNAIIVTANRRAEVITEVPLSITAVSDEELRLRQINDFQSLTSQVPGFVVQNISAGENRLILRGQNSGSTGASVATVIDDIPFSFFTSKGSSGLLAANVDTWDLERIEVLRGPQGTLYGAAAQGGLIKYVTKRPDLYDIEGAAEASLYDVKGGEAGGAVRGAINVPLVEGKLAFRASGVYESIPGWIDNPLGDETNFNDGEKKSFRASLLAQPIEDMTIRLTVYHQEIDSDGGNSVQVVGSALNPSSPPADVYDRVAGYTFNSYNPAIVRNEFTVYSGELNFDLGFAEFISVTSYGTLETFFTSDTGINNLAPGFTINDAFVSLWAEPVSIGQVQTEELEKINQEIRLASGPGTIEWQVGAFYSKEDTVFDQQFFGFSQATGEALPTIVPGLVIGGSLNPVDAESWAGFGEATFNLTDQFEISAGARYTETDQSQRADLILGILYSAPSDPPVSYVTDKDWTYSLSAKWNPVDGTMIYGRVATGFRPGGPLFNAASFFNSDKTTNYEIGVRSDLIDRVLSAEITAYQIDWTDIQIVSRTTVNDIEFTTTGNAGEARSRGVEWSLTARPASGLSFDFLGAYTDAELTEDAPEFGGLAGEALAYIPEWSFTLNADYEFDLSDDLSGYFGGSYTYVDSRFTDFTTSSIQSNHVEIPSYNTVSLFAGIRNDSWGLQVFARNLTNEFGIVNYSAQGGFGQTGRATAITPRTIGVIASMNF